MGRKEDRKLKRRLGVSNKPVPMDPFIGSDGSLVFPVHSDNLSNLGLMNADELMRTTSTISDRDLNQLLYSQARHAVANGYGGEWPEDDFGSVMWFLMYFITHEMQETFPAIAREYLAHEKMVGEDFHDVPYPRMGENTWDDALNYRILAMMIMAARRGSTYSKNFLISLYKVYYKQEYNHVRKLRKLTYLDVLEIHDDDCRRKGYASGHATSGEKSFGEYLVEKRQHEAGWTNVSGNRLISSSPTHEHEEPSLSEAASYVRDMVDAPEEPPLQPVASRLFIMCEMLGIPIDATCNTEAGTMNEGIDSINKLAFLLSPEYRRLRQEFIDRDKEFIKATYPEMADPFEYQTKEEYFALEMAEEILTSAFHKYDRNVRLPYDSKKFDLVDLIAEATLTMHMAFPGLKFTFGDAQFMAMIQYLSECLCDLMITRDREIEELLHFRARLNEGEWAEDEDNSEWVLKTVEKLRPAVEPTPTQQEAEPEKTVPQTEDDLRAEIDALKAQLAEKEMQLVEAEQKTIRQRVLYERARDNERELRKTVADREDEHTELIALREFVYGLRSEDIELDEADRERMVADLRDKKVAVLGGHERWQKKMKRMFPDWAFISVDDDSIGGFNALEGADYIYIYTNALQHKQYYRAMNLIRKEGKALFYLGGTNINENVIRIHRDLCR